MLLGRFSRGGDFAEFKLAIVTEQQYLPMPVIQGSDRGHQFDAAFRKDQRVERTCFVLSQEDRSDSTTMPEGFRRLGNEARQFVRRVWRLGTQLLGR